MKLQAIEKDDREVPPKVPRARRRKRKIQDQEVEVTQANPWRLNC